MENISKLEQARFMPLILPQHWLGILKQSKGCGREMSGHFGLWEGWKTPITVAPSL